MKKLLFLFGLLFLFSCEKKPPCWVCEIRQTEDKTLYFTFCDKTEGEIKDYEKINTFEHNLGGTPWYQTTKCTLK